MKQVILIFLLGVVYSAFGQIEDTSTKGMNLKGAVEQIVQVQYEFHSMEAKDAMKTTLCTFDREGKLTSIQESTPDGDGTTHLLYYAEGLLIKDVITFSESGAKAVNTHEYDGQLRVKTTWQQFDGESDTPVTTMETQYTYNDKGQLVKEQLIGGDVVVIEENTFTYNEDGKVKSTISSFEGEDFESTYIYVDEYRTEEVEVNLTYDQESVGVIQRDEFMNEIFNSVGMFENAYSYEYDDQNNWIVKKEMITIDIDTSPGYAYTREITYYE